MPLLAGLPLLPDPADIVKKLEPKRTREKIGTELRQFHPHIEIVKEFLVTGKAVFPVSPQIFQRPQGLRLIKLILAERPAPSHPCSQNQVCLGTEACV